MIDSDGTTVCRKPRCKTYVYDYGLCIKHLKEQWLKDGTLTQYASVVEAPTAKIDAEEVVVADDTAELETRDEEG